MTDQNSAKMVPIVTVDRSEAILKALAEFVEAAGLSPGARLPTERDLMERLGVGRSSVREALKHWQALGIIEARKGSGSYLRRPIRGSTVHVPISIEAERDGLLMTLEVRRGLEGEAAALAARRATAADLAEIEAKLEIMEAVHHEQGTAGPEDLAFHVAIYNASHNPLFEQILSQIRDAFGSFFVHPFDRRDFALRSFPFHRMLFDAIVSRDEAAARRHTDSILDIVREDIIEMSATGVTRPSQSRASESPDA